MDRLPLPEALVAQARSYAEGSATPAEPRDAATVVLLRPGTTGPEVYLLRRTRGMPFAGGMSAYPGGGVDDRDGDTDLAWVGPPPADWAAAFGCDERLARELVCAAVRETFEEAGVLLAGPVGGDSVVPDVSGDDWEEQRQALLAREVSRTAAQTSSRASRSSQPNAEAQSAGDGPAQATSVSPSRGSTPPPG